MKVLVANRGEIAIRVIRALREMGLPSVAVYSDEDRNSPHVALADEAWCLGPGQARQSYLHQGRLLTAAKLAGAGALHPGYGFLSENAAFAGACERAGINFIGPRGEVMARLANKLTTKMIVAGAGVPVIAGSVGPLRDAAHACSVAREINWPVLLKASFGGGGRGIYLVREEGEMPKLFATAQTESRAAVGNTELYLEKHIAGSRHVEVQVACDKKGACVAFVERDCTIQRRHQKLLEESPSVFVDEVLRPLLLAAGRRAAVACGLTSLATVEFLLRPDKKTFYFLEINKRIQVEHPVTEELLGLDLLQLQITLAFGEALPAGIAAQAGRVPQARPSRHVIEVRLNAEDPARNFLPQEGWAYARAMPSGPGVRLDTFLKDSIYIGSSYDSLLAKLIVASDRGRPGALARLKRALAELEIGGLATTAGLYEKLLRDPAFSNGKEWFSTDFLQEWLPKQQWN